MNNEYYSKPSEGLIHFLPAHQKKFAQGPSFLALCEAIDKHLREYSSESKSELVHAKDLFDHFCSTHPDYEKEKGKCEIHKIEKEKESKLNSLYLQYANCINY